MCVFVVIPQTKKQWCAYPCMCVRVSVFLVKCAYPHVTATMSKPSERDIERKKRESVSLAVERQSPFFFVHVQTTHWRVQPIVNISFDSIRH